ncbi:MAG TPA: class I SAM-dependent methyltransferase [Pyrinomonadaceae bacterium]|nr:class I SAM-dependent methyltransferase [Pyrinomonadaceae bacterium]
MNFFSSRSAAARYPKGRPYFHPLVIERIRQFLSLAQPVARAVDVGCGTGLSALALKGLAREVVGVDSSAEMLALAQIDSSVRYAVADALQLPFREDEFDLMTLSSAFHWLDRSKFLREAGRVLRARGWLVVYDNYFAGRMEENDAFENWYRESYLKVYPPPGRSKLFFSEESSGNEGFNLTGQEQYQNRVSFSITGLVDYLTTQSNVIAAVEVGGDEEVDRARLWLSENLKPLYGEMSEATFPFRGPIWYLQNIS